MKQITIVLLLAGIASSGAQVTFTLDGKPVTGGGLAKYSLHRIMSFFNGGQRASPQALQQSLAGAGSAQNYKVQGRHNNQFHSNGQFPGAFTYNGRPAAPKQVFNGFGTTSSSAAPSSAAPSQFSYAPRQNQLFDPTSASPGKSARHSAAKPSSSYDGYDMAFRQNFQVKGPNGPESVTVIDTHTMDSHSPSDFRDIVRTSIMQNMKKTKAETFRVPNGHYGQLLNYRNAAPASREVAFIPPQVGGYGQPSAAGFITITPAAASDPFASIFSTQVKSNQKKSETSKPGTPKPQIYALRAAAPQAYIPFQGGPQFFQAPVQNFAPFANAPPSFDSYGGPVSPFGYQLSNPANIQHNFIQESFGVPQQGGFQFLQFPGAPVNQAVPQNVKPPKQKRKDSKKDAKSRQYSIEISPSSREAIK